MSVLKDKLCDVYVHVERKQVNPNNTQRSNLETFYLILASAFANAKKSGNKISISVLIGLIRLPIRKTFKNIIQFKGFDDYIEFDIEYPTLVKEFDGLEIIQDLSTQEQLITASRYGTLTNISLGIDSSLSQFVLPDTLTGLQLYQVRVDKPLPSTIQDLTIVCAKVFKTSFITLQLDYVCFTRIGSLVLDKCLPVTLKQLNLDEINFKDQVDFTYLVNVTRVVIEDALYSEELCWDFLNLPLSITYLQLSDCYVQSLISLQTLTQLEQLYIHNISVADFATMDVKYPNSLKILKVSHPWVRQHDLKESNPWVFYADLPPNLEEFRLIQAMALHSEVKFPENLKRLELKSIEKVYYEHDGEYRKVFRDFQFSENLRELTITNCLFKKIVNTNILSLPKLKLENTIDIVDHYTDSDMSLEEYDIE